VYASFSGFDEATPAQPGHVFFSADGGQTWAPRGTGVNVPVNDLLQNPELPGFLYAATDLGVMATNDGGKTWGVLGQGMPNVPVYSLGYRGISRSLVAFTWGRSAFEIPFVPDLLLAQDEVAIHASYGQKEAEGELLIANAEPYGSELSVSVSTDTPWLATRAPIGRAVGQGKVVVKVRAFPAGLSAGEHQGSVTVTPAGGAPVVVPVKLGISVAQAPAPPSLLPADTYAAGGGGCSFGPGRGEVSWALALLGLLALRRRRRR
jgi:MYXO-CTERM domain-containing protein